MRNQKFISVAVGVLLLTTGLFIGTSCNNDEGTQYKRIELKLTGREWRYKKIFNQAYHYYVKMVPELTEDLFNRAFKSMYLVVGGNEKTPLPYPQPFVAGGSYFTEYLKYSFAPGRVTFRLAASDSGLYAIHPPCKQFVMLLRW